MKLLETYDKTHVPNLDQLLDIVYLVIFELNNFLFLVEAYGKN